MDTAIPIFVFTRKDGKTLRWRGSTPIPSELSALLLGIKPIAYCTSRRADAIQAKRIAEFFGLRYAPVNMDLASSPNPRGTTEFLLAKESGLLKEAAAMIRTGEPAKHGIRWSRLLGYPDCCSRAQREYYLRGRFIGMDIVTSAWMRSERTDGPFSFHLNNVFNFNGVGFHGMNLGRDLRPLNVVPWQPCSYQCQESLAAGVRIWCFLEALFPGFARPLKEALTRPVLYLRKDQFAVLEGEITSPRSCAYEGLLAPRGLLSPARQELLSRGDALSITPGRVLIHRRGALIGSFLHKKPLLLHFG